MALVTPISLPIDAFDATNNQTFYFNVKGGSQVVKNRLTIRKNSDDSVVYQNELYSYSFQQTVPKGTLTNGEYYNFYFNTYDTDDNISSNSNVIQFYCYTTPTLTFVNIKENDKIEDSSFNFEVKYNQKEKELLNELKFYLYDENESLIQNSGAYYSSSQPPVNFTHTFSGLIDKSKYKIKVIGNTVNGTTIDSGFVKFTVSYKTNNVYFELNLNNDCLGGCVNIEPNIITIDGEVNPSPPTYVDNNTALLLMKDWYLKWDNGFSFSSNNFELMEFWRPTKLGNSIILYGSNDGDRIELNLNRFENSNGVYDYIEVLGYNNDVLYFKKNSNSVGQLTVNDDIITFLRFKNGVIDITLYVKNRVVTTFTWNVKSNLQYNLLTDVSWVGESYPQQSSEESKLGFNYFNVNKIRLMGGIVDHIDISKNVDREFTTTKPFWDTYTILNCDFDGNINGGNVTFILSQVDSVKLKRRLSTELDWLTIYSKEVKTVEDFDFLYKDYLIKSNEEYEWAVVPCLGSKEITYSINNLETKFDGIFITDKTKTMKLYSGVTYSEDKTNQEIAILKPYNKKYPKIISNKNINYKTMTIVGQILDDKFIVDNDKIVKKKEEFNKFLTNGLPKVIKDWNGNIILGNVTTSPSYSYSSVGMVIPTISFGVTEQGEYDNENDLEMCGFLEQ